MIKIDFPQASVDAWVEKAKGKANEFAVEFLQDMNEAVVVATPFKTGFLRGSWWASLNADPDGQGSLDPSGAAAIARLNLTLADLVLGDVYNAINGAAYAGYLENGTSRILPRFYVRGTVAQAEIIADRAARRVADGVDRASTPFDFL